MGTSAAAASSRPSPDVATSFSNGCGLHLEGNHDLELRKLIRVEVLILDDFCLHSLDAADTADFYELIVERHRQATAAIVTTKREPPSE